MNIDSTRYCVLCIISDNLKVAQINLRTQLQIFRAGHVRVLQCLSWYHTIPHTSVQQFTAFYVDKL